MGKTVHLFFGHIVQPGIICTNMTVVFIFLLTSLKLKVFLKILIYLVTTEVRQFLFPSQKRISLLTSFLAVLKKVKIIFLDLPVYLDSLKIFSRSSVMHHPSTQLKGNRWSSFFKLSG